jgi:hypothetical protein
MPYAGLDYVGSCAEQDRLVDDLDDAATQYAHAVGDLVARMGTMQEPAYSMAKASVDIARQRAEDARKALLEHRKQHGC